MKFYWIKGFKENMQFPEKRTPSTPLTTFYLEFQVKTLVELKACLFSIRNSLHFHEYLVAIKLVASKLDALWHELTE